MTQKKIEQQGRYYWELLFDIDNSNNNGIIDRTTEIKTVEKINTKDFYSQTLNVKAVFDFKNESSISLKLEEVGQVGKKMEFSIHLEAGMELTKTTENFQEKITEKTEIRKFSVGPKSKLTMYRLCYVASGIIVKSDIVASNPKDIEDIHVNLTYSLATRLLGLPEMVDLLLEIRPGVDNIEEWKTIREELIRSTGASQDEIFRNLVTTCSKIEPDRDNRSEWENIRTTCSEILSAWDKTETQLLFNKLLTRFSTTHPLEDNRDEWKRIREMSKSILDGMKQVL
ncbi:hypothetical protein [Dapis sp. BLCC M229]|uniref:hypothetical protein n=1 Tax=Dapis sp. BLCC M229 TaxID=3400188 RepID=UPI003CF919EC